MKCAIIIPARLESTRLPGKLLLDQTGQPLICHTLQVAVAAKAMLPDVISDIIVAADDESIIAAVERRRSSDGGFSQRAVMTRKDHSSGSDRIAEAASGLPDDIDVIVNLQGDEPDIDPGLLVRVLETLKNSPESDIATVVSPIRDKGRFNDPALVKAVVAADSSALYFSRAPIPFDRDGQGGCDGLGYGHFGIYAYRRKSLERFVSLPAGKLEILERLEQLRALEHGMKIAVRIENSAPPAGIDTPEDYSAFVARCKSGI